MNKNEIHIGLSIVSDLCFLDKPYIESFINSIKKIQNMPVSIDKRLGVCDSFVRFATEVISYDEETNALPTYPILDKKTLEKAEERSQKLFRYLVEIMKKDARLTKEEWDNIARIMNDEFDQE